MRVGKTALGIIVAVCGLATAAGLALSGDRYASGPDVDRIYREVKERYTPNTPRHQRAREFGRALLARSPRGADECSRHLAAYGYTFIGFDDRARAIVLDAYRDAGCSPAALRAFETRLIDAMAGKAEKPAREPAGRSL